MRKILLTSAIFAIILSMNNCKTEDIDNTVDTDTGPYSLIGTWEASGEMNVLGDERTYKMTLTFIDETEYTQIQHEKSKQGAWDQTVEQKGTYIQDEEKITYTDSYRTSPEADFAGNNEYSKPYKFANKNTLETYGPGITDFYIKSMVYKRK